MGYKYEEENISKIDHFNIVTGSNNISKPSEELQEVYRKAKVYDDINKLLVEVFKQEEPLYLVDEYERGLYNAYYEIVGIIQEHMECADDEKYKNNNSKNDAVSKYNDRLDDDNIMG